MYRMTEMQKPADSISTLERNIEKAGRTFEEKDIK